MKEFQAKQKAILHDTPVEGFYFCKAPSESLENPESTLSAAHEHENISYSIKDIRKHAERAGYNQGLLEGQQQGYEAGKSEGYELGLKQGHEQSLADLRSTISLFNQAADAFALKQKELFEQAKPEIISFCMAVCERILKRELSDSHSFKLLIETILREAKSILVGVSAEIAISPEDLVMIEQNIHEIDYNKEDFNGLIFTVDDSLERGNCRLETSLGLINFDLRRLLSDLEKEVLEIE